MVCTCLCVRVYSAIKRSNKKFLSTCRLKIRAVVFSKSKEGARRAVWRHPEVSLSTRENLEISPNEPIQKIVSRLCKTEFEIILFRAAAAASATVFSFSHQ